MLRRNAFVVVALLALIFSAAFSSWTQDTPSGSNSGPPAVRSFPPDFTRYSRPAIPGDVIPLKSAKP